ncbi:MAG: CopD family protein [Gammaproteobacteria bacterium]|jgi:putative membrane protein|nr:CopD family protein [Gammaproteobacteria bacterium]
MLWIKSFHLIFIISWMAALLYLPRLFVNWAEVDDDSTRQRLALMMRRLLKLGHVAMGGSLLFGLWLLGWWVGHSDDYMSHGWLHAKLALVLLLIAYQISISRISKRLIAGDPPRSSKWYRWFNEIPAVAMLAIVILVVVKPF